jgi:uncharacterized protein YjaZ
MYLLRNEILWFLKAIRVTQKNNKQLKNLQKEGTNKRNLSNEQLKKYIELSKKYLHQLKMDTNRSFVLSQELERHLKYSRFSERYVVELFNEIIKYMNLDNQKIKLKINYISSKVYLGYAGLYSDKNEIKEITINIGNDMTIDTIISILAHESTHYLLISNGIQLKERIHNECLTDITAIILGFKNYMIEGYKIFNNVKYDTINKRIVNKNRVGYLTYKDIKYVGKIMKIVK